MSTINVTVEVLDSVDTISVNYENQVTAITVTEVMPQIQVVQVDAGEQNLITSVNDLFGSVQLTYRQTLTYVQQSGGLYQYLVTHNLGYDNPVVVVYNNENDIVMTEVEVVDSNILKVISTSNLNGFKVVVQI